MAERQATGGSMGAALRMKVETVGAFAPPAANEVEAASSNAGSRILEASLVPSTHTHRAGRGRKEEGYICHFIDISYSTRLEMTFLIGSVCCRPNIDFVVCERQFQL